MAEVVAPLDRVGDTVGSRARPGDRGGDDPAGFADAYRRYVDAGWGSVPFAPEHGGGGFPWLVALAMQEMLTSANIAFSLCPLLTQGAIDMLEVHGAEEQQERYLRQMVSGEWTGTMNLTEPQAGSDVGALRTRAVPAPTTAPGAISGTKIFITYGEHDMADNIVHLVLARVARRAAGDTRDLVASWCPKILRGRAGTTGCGACRSSTSSASTPARRASWTTTRPSATSSARPTPACATCSR